MDAEAKVMKINRFFDIVPKRTVAYPSQLMQERKKANIKNSGR